MLVHLFSAALLAAGVIYHRKTVNKLNESLKDKDAIIAAIQLHVDAVSKKRDSLVSELRSLKSVSPVKSTETKSTHAPTKNEFPIDSTLAVAVKKKKTYKRKPKTKVDA